MMVDRQLLITGIAVLELCLAAWWCPPLVAQVSQAPEDDSAAIEDVCKLHLAEQLGSTLPLLWDPDDGSLCLQIPAVDPDRATGDPQPRQLQIVAADTRAIVHRSIIVHSDAAPLHLHDLELPAGVYEVQLDVDHAPRWQRFWQREPTVDRERVDAALRWTLLVASPSPSSSGDEPAQTDESNEQGTTADRDLGIIVRLSCPPQPTTDVQDPIVAPPAESSPSGPSVTDRLVSWRRTATAESIQPFTRLVAHYRDQVMTWMSGQRGNAGWNIHELNLVWSVPVRPTPWSNLWTEFVLAQADALDRSIFVHPITDADVDPTDTTRSDASHWTERILEFHSQWFERSPFGGLLVDTSLDGTTNETDGELIDALESLVSSVQQAPGVKLIVVGTSEELADWAYQQNQVRWIQSRRRSPPSTLAAEYSPESGHQFDSDGHWFGFYHWPSRGGSSLDPVEERDSQTGESMRQTIAANTVSRLPTWIPQPWTGTADHLDLVRESLPVDWRMVDAWHKDWMNWVTTTSSKSSSLGDILIDDALLVATDTQQDIQLHQWMRQSSGRWCTAPESALVQLYRVDSDDTTTLILFNQAPWAESVSIETLAETRWIGVSDNPISLPSGLRKGMVVPQVTGNIAKVVVRPSGWVICQSTAPLADRLTYDSHLVGGDPAREELQGSVTTVIERLGLLSELRQIDQWHRSAGTESAVTSPDRSESRPRSLDRFLPSLTSMTPMTAIERLSRSSHHRIARPLVASSRADQVEGGLITNGGFEPQDFPSESADLSGIAGWMHAQHPTHAVIVDRDEPHTGQGCVRMIGIDSSGSQSWLISQPIGTPATGRLSVSLATRCEPSEASEDGSVSPTMESGRIRVAIEGRRGQQPCRHGEVIEIPADGRWQPRQLALQWIDLEPSRHGDLRLTIDNLSSSTVWIDDVYVTDWFASEEERNQLQRLAFLAVQGLQRSDRRPSAKLLQDFWAQQLVRFQPTSLDVPEQPESKSAASDRMMTSSWRRNQANAVPVPSSRTPVSRPITNHAPASQPDIDDAEREPSEDSETPSIGMADRLRRWLPSPLRF
ncbi:MAG: hypothetical protein AAF670_15400 [Planctomycetota bacterium]